MAPLVANARMYAVTPAVEAHWRDLLVAIGRAAGLDLDYAEHRAPTPLDALWARDDLGLAFMCGWPFANLHPHVQPVAAPIPAISGGRPAYWTDLVVDAARDLRTLEAAAGLRVGWTVEHSQSGFRAVRRHLDMPGEAARPAWIGPLVTPRRVAEAVLAGEIDLGPLDSYWHALLVLHEPETAGRLRVVASTRPTPLPLLVASAAVDPAIVAGLREAAVASADAPSLRPAFEALGLAGFAPATRAAYAPLIEPPG